jgi:ribosomal protein L11 methyltransferase
VRTWPAIEVARLKPAAKDAPDLLQAALVDYRIAAIDESVADQWRVFFSTDAERDRAAANLTRQFPDLTLTPLDVPDEDWVARSQAGLRAVRVGNIIVAPPWDIPHTGKLKLDLSANSSNAAGLRRPVVIVIKPSMGFGTGHHATTRLCLGALQRIDLHGTSALDVGTGSGVLAIAASRLGAAPVVGIDDDVNAIQAAEENLTLNRGADVTLTTADVRTASPGTFDLVTANLTGGLLIDAASRLRDLAKPGAQLILSGFLRHEEQAVLAAYQGCTVTDRAEEEEWVCVSVQRP